MRLKAADKNNLTMPPSDLLRDGRREPLSRSHFPSPLTPQPFPLKAGGMFTGVYVEQEGVMFTRVYIKQWSYYALTGRGRL